VVEEHWSLIQQLKIPCNKTLIPKRKQKDRLISLLTSFFKIFGKAMPSRLLKHIIITFYVGNSMDFR
jgi:hypothetical protein